MDYDKLKQAYENWTKRGIITDEELDLLLDASNQAKALALALNAGAAVENYYVNLWYGLAQIKFARGRV